MLSGHSGGFTCFLKGRRMLQGCQDLQAPKEHSRRQQGGSPACCAPVAKASCTAGVHWSSLQGLTLKRHIDATLGSGNMREAVRLPPGVAPSRYTAAWHSCTACPSPPGAAEHWHRDMLAHCGADQSTSSVLQTMF